MPISAFLSKSGHTFYYLRKQIANDISRGSPTFHYPTVGTQIVTFFGISHLFVPFDLPTTGDTSWDIPAFLPPLNCHTNSDIHWDIPSFSLPSINQPLGALLRTPPLFSPSLICYTNNDIRWDTPTFLSPTKRDTFDYIQLVCHRFTNTEKFLQHF